MPRGQRRLLVVREPPFNNAFKGREVAADFPQIESRQDRFLRFALEQELEGTLQKRFFRILPARKLPVIFAAYRHLMSRLARAFGNAYLKFPFAQRGNFNFWG